MHFVYFSSKHAPLWRANIEMIEIGTRKIVVYSYERYTGGIPVFVSAILVFFVAKQKEPIFPLY